MGFRMRKSFKVMPGVRMTVTPRGVSTSVGTTGARVNVHSSGRVTSTLGVPGTGIAHVSTSTTSSRRAPARARAIPKNQRADVFVPARAVRPGALAPRWEKELYRALTTGNVEALGWIAARYPAVRHLCMFLDGFIYQGPDHDQRTTAVFEELWHARFQPEQHPFIQRYVSEAGVVLGIAPGIRAELPLGRDAIGMTLVELRQGAGDLVGAITLAESLDPSAPAAVSLAELYGQQQRWTDIVDMTNGLTDDDDFTLFLLTQRGVALRQLGYFEAARAVFKASLARRSQPTDLKHRTLVERALTYRAEGKKAMARKDLERILAEDSEYPGLSALLADLSAPAHKQNRA